MLDLTKIGAAIGAAVAQGSAVGAGTVAASLTDEQRQAWGAIIPALPVDVKVPVQVLEAELGIELVPAELASRSPSNRAGDLAKLLRGAFSRAEGPADAPVLWLSGYAEQGAKGEDGKPTYTGTLQVAVRTTIPERAGVHVKQGGRFNSDGTTVS